MSQAIEVVLFNGKPGVTAEQMMSAAQRGCVKTPSRD